MFTLTWLPWWGQRSLEWALWGMVDLQLRALLSFQTAVLGLWGDQGPVNGRHWSRHWSQHWSRHWQAGGFGRLCRYCQCSYGSLPSHSILATIVHINIHPDRNLFECHKLLWSCFLLRPGQQNDVKWSQFVQFTYVAATFIADYPALSVDRAGSGNPLYAEDTPNQEFLIWCAPIQEFLNWCVTNQDQSL